MRVISVAFVIWLCLTALIVGAVAYGSTRIESNPLRELGFDVCDGQPCLAGIIPGVTTTKDAYTFIVQRFNSIPRFPVGHMSVFMDDINADFGVDLHTNKIWFVTATINHNTVFPSLDNLVALYGLPCAVHAYEVNTSIVINVVFQHMRVVVSAIHGRLSLNSSIQHVSVTAGQGAGDYCDSSEIETHRMRRWQGFTKIERYLPG